MKRFCFHCGKRIPADRLQRGSIYFSDECRRVARIEARAAAAKKKCRLCGRGLPCCCEALRKELAAVRRAHTCTVTSIAGTNYHSGGGRKA